jgi:hypothetical protein
MTFHMSQFTNTWKTCSYFKAKFQIFCILSNCICRVMQKPLLHSRRWQTVKYTTYDMDSNHRMSETTHKVEYIIHDNLRADKVSLFNSTYPKWKIMFCCVIPSLVFDGAKRGFSTYARKGLVRGSE